MGKLIGHSVMMPFPIIASCWLSVILNWAQSMTTPQNQASEVQCVFDTFSMGGISDCCHECKKSWIEMPT